MRHLLALICVCTLGPLPLTGCSDNTGLDGMAGEDASGGEDGFGGDAGDGGMAGEGGSGGGTGGIDGHGGSGGAQECEVPGDCENTQCMDATCADGICEYAPFTDGAPCEAGLCHSGECRPITSVFPCTEEGINDAIAVGGGPHGFACDGPTTVVTETEIVIDNDVILDGLNHLSVQGGENDYPVFTVAPGAIAHLRRLKISGVQEPLYGGNGVQNSGVLSLTEVTVQMNNGSGIANSGELTVVRSLVAGNARNGIANGGVLEITESEISENALVGIQNGGTSATATLTDVMVSGNGERSRLGGGIMNVTGSSLSMTRCSVSDNRASFGGGLYNLGSAMLFETTVSDNTSTSSGGGVYNKTSNANLVLVRCTVAGNTSEASGGGVTNYDYAALTLIESIVSGNAAGFAEYQFPHGGGIFNGASSMIEIIDSVITRNVSAYSGGGIHNDGPATMSLTSSTVSENRAESGNGGGIHQRSYFDLTSFVTNTTISGNYAAGVGGGIANQGKLSVRNSTLVENIGTRAAVSDDPSGPGPVTVTNSIVEGDCGGGPLASGGYNIEGPGDTCGLDQPSDRSMVTPAQLLLGPLAENGGPTKTHALLSGSIAIDVIPEAECPLDTDQRGVARPQGAMCDVGAFEVQPGDAM